MADPRDLLPPGFQIETPTDPMASLPAGFKIEQPQAASQPSTAADVVKSGGSGLVEGLTGIPGALQRFPEFVGNKILGLFGVPELTPEQQAKMHPLGMIPTGTEIAKAAGLYHEPQTTAGEYARTAGQFAPAALGPGSILQRAANVAIPATTSETAGQLTKGTPYEPYARFAGGLAGVFGIPAFNVAKEGASRLVAGSGPTQAAQEAHGAGFVLPPNMASEKPGAVSNVLSAAGGKVKMQQAASIKNQSVTNKLAAEEVGLPGDQQLTPDALKAVRDQAGQAYTAISQAMPVTSTDLSYEAAVQSLGNRMSAAAKEFPTLVKNGEIENLRSSLSGKGSFSTEAAIQLIRKLRSDSDINFKAFDKPAQLALAKSQRDAANAVEGLLERRLTQLGNPDLINQFRQARQLIAKTYDVQRAMNPATGNINASKMAKIGEKKPLTGNLKTIANVGGTFPKAVQPVESIGGHERLSILDALAAGLSHFKTLGLSLARPAVRSGVLSSPYQNLVMRNPTPLGPPMLNALGNNPLGALLSFPNAMRPPQPLDDTNYGAR